MLSIAVGNFNSLYEKQDSHDTEPDAYECPQRNASCFQYREIEKRVQCDGEDNSGLNCNYFCNFTLVESKCDGKAKGC